MKWILLPAVAAFMLACIQTTAQTHIDVTSCPWITQSTSEGPDQLPVTTTEIGPGPDGYYLFYSNAAETNLLMEGELGNGLRQGQWKYYNPDGTLYSRCQYSNGKMNGLYEVLNPDGSVSLSLQMLNDSPVENK